MSHPSFSGDLLTLSAYRVTRDTGYIFKTSFGKIMGIPEGLELNGN